VAPLAWVSPLVVLWMLRMEVDLTPPVVVVLSSMVEVVNLLTSAGAVPVMGVFRAKPMEVTEVVKEERLDRGEGMKA